MLKGKRLIGRTVFSLPGARLPSYSSALSVTSFCDR